MRSRSVPPDYQLPEGRHIVTTGLQDIPLIFPCAQQGTARTQHGDIDETRQNFCCATTKSAGGCPWMQHLADHDGAPPERMFNCAIDGLYGSWLLDTAGCDGGVLFDTSDPEQCQRIATTMRSKYEIDGIRMPVTALAADEWQGDDITGPFWYLHDWLLFTAEHGSGFGAWP